MLSFAYRWLNPRWCIWYLNHCLKGYIVNRGLHALLPKRKEPFTREMLVSMTNLDPPVSKSSAVGPCDNVHDFIVMLTLLKILAQTGMRLSELICTEDECPPSLC